MNKIIKNKPLDYKLLQYYVRRLKKLYPSIRIATCGKSVLGKEIYAFVWGEGKRNIVYVGGTHGLEWVTSVTLLRFCESLLSREYICGYNVKNLLRNCTLIIIPALNPDGVEISQKTNWVSLSAFPSSQIRRIFRTHILTLLPGSSGRLGLMIR